MQKLRGIILFDIDGVIRDVSGSYRQAIQETVVHFTNWQPSPADIDSIKSEGHWNNDWDASIELIKRQNLKLKSNTYIPSKKEVIKIFNGFYFGGDPNQDPQSWKGFINNEPLLVTKELFSKINSLGFKWGFVSGSERSSAEFVLERKLGLKNPPLISMNDAPEKPNPIGLITLAKRLANQELGKHTPSISYLGDTVADILTVKNARLRLPNQKFISFAVAPPHLHNKVIERKDYEEKLKQAGANSIINSTNEILDELKKIR